MEGTQHRSWVGCAKSKGRSTKGRAPSLTNRRKTSQFFGQLLGNKDPEKRKQDEGDIDLSMHVVIVDVPTGIPNTWS